MTNDRNHILKTAASSLLAWAFLLTFIPITVPRLLHGQVLYVSIAGTITDQARTSIEKARVEALNVDTGASQVAATDERGSYVLSNLMVGTYKVTITATSFGTQVYEKVKVAANTLRLDVRLRASGSTDTSPIGGPGEVLRTDRSDVSFTQTSRLINDLPLTGSVSRNYQSLMSLIPGAVSQGELGGQAENPQRSTSFNVNGVSRLQNNTRIDGVSNIHLFLPNNVAYVPPAESIEEVSIVTNSMDAEHGFVGGAVIHVTTKSGTNNFHGALWGYNTNSATQARNYFQTTPEIPKKIVTQYGYALGGPILKNKLFFFTDLERSTERGTSRFNTVSLAPVSLRPNAGGNVVFPAAANGGATIYDPASNANPALRTPFPNNTIPADRIDLAALELIKRLPAPTGNGFSNNFVANGATPFNRTHIDTKVDYITGSRLRVFGRYSISPTSLVDPQLFGEAGGPALNGGYPGEARGRTQVAGLGGTFFLSSTLLFDANAGFTRQHLGGESFDTVSNFGLDVLKIPGTNGTDRMHAGIPSFQINNWANLGNDSIMSPFSYRDNQYVLTANLSWLKGAHSFRFGLDDTNQQLNHFDPQGATQTVRGSFTFNGNSTSLQSGPAPSDVRFNSWADFLLGLPAVAGKLDKDINPNAVYMRSYALYARDRWRISRHLSLDLGVRWERYPFPDKDNTGVNRFDPATGNVITGGLDDVPRDTGAKSGPGQFLPRIGLAYRLGEKTVVRSGYGQSADPRSFKDIRNGIYPGYFRSWTMPQQTFNGATNLFVPVTTLRQGLINPNGTAPTAFTAGIIKLPSALSTTTYPAEAQRKYIQSWNLTLQRELPWNLTGQIGYIGTRAVGQMGSININAAAPGTGNAGRALAALGLTASIFSIQPYKTATYDGLQAELTRRWASSTFGAAYTFSKAINYADDGAGPRIQYYPEAHRNRGPASYDRRHNLQLYGVWDLPFGRGQRWASSGLAGTLLGGFQLNGVVAVTSGAPISIIQGSAGNLSASGSGQYPDQVKPEVAIMGGIGPGNPYFDTKAYAPVNIPAGQTQRFGNAGRNNIYGPGFFNADLGLFRTFSLTERLKLQVRTEALNALNHPNFANPGGDVSNAGSFGFVTSTVGQGRVLRFAARVSF